MTEIDFPNPPIFRDDIRDLIDQHHESEAEDPRAHLGASILGGPCERKLWYAFRWAFQEKFAGRMLRLFNRGHEEEARFVRFLRRIGVEVLTINPTTGKQFRWSILGGHVGGSQDGAATRVPKWAVGEWGLLEFKTHNDASFTKLVKLGVRNCKPEHWDQMVLYMAWSGLRRALYCAVNKNDDTLHFEEVLFDEQAQARVRDLTERAERVVFSDEPLVKIAKDESFYKCKMCPAKKLCHGKQMPAVNCRTCAHSTPERDGTDGRWTCALQGKDLTLDEQLAGCDNHVINPHLLVNHAELLSLDGDRNCATYRTPSGIEVSNGTAGPGVMPSKELVTIADLSLLSPELMEARAYYEGSFVSVRPLVDDEPAEEYTEVEE